MKRIAIVIGHNLRAQGAVRATDGRTEYDWNDDLAGAIRALAPDRYRIVIRTPGAGEIGRAYSEVDRLGVAASVELHFNGSADPRATGTETLSSGTANSLKLAHLMQAEMVRALGMRDRGVKIIGKTGRGGASLWTGKPPSVLLEPYFGSNRSDCDQADQRFNALAAAIHRACSQFLGEADKAPPALPAIEIPFTQPTLWQWLVAFFTGKGA
jgi:N-acetylmuramoyl-L-alanine amidase